MSIYEIVIFTTFASLLVVSPGPNGLLIAKSVATGSLARADGNIFGFIVAFYLHGLLSVLGISAILMKSSEAFFIFKTLGALYLFYLGIRSLYSVIKFNPDTASKAMIKSERGGLKQSVLKDFSEGFLTNALNPKVSLFYLAVFPQFIGASDSVFFWSFVLISIHALLNAIWFRLLAMVINKSKTFAIKPPVKRALDALTGIVFIGFAIKLFTAKNTV